MSRVGSTQLDKWLKGIDGFADLPEEEIDARIEALRAELESTRLKLAVLMQLRGGPAPRRIQVGRAPRAEPVAAIPRKVDESTRPHDWKRRAVLTLMRSHPNKVWSASEIRDALISNGVMTTEEGTPTRLLLRRLDERGDIQKVGTAAYTMVADRLQLSPNGSDQE
jgi:hypothetical protein